MDICIMDADGGNLAQLTYSDGISMCNTWSRDNKRIAFWSDRYGNADIFIMDVSAKKPGNGIYAGMLLIVFIGFLAYLGMYIKKRGRT